MKGVELELAGEAGANEVSELSLRGDAQRAGNSGDA